MYILFKGIPRNCIVLPNFNVWVRILNAACIHQFKVHKPVYYPDRRQENLRINEQLKSQLIAEPKQPKQIPKDYYYKVLGVHKDATSTEIKATFYALAKRFHPDARHEQPAVSKQFQDILSAYRVLCDEVKRKEYDQSGKVNDAPSNPQFPFECTAPKTIIPTVSKVNQKPEEIIFKASKEELLQMTSIDPKLELTFLESVHGVKKIIDMNTLKKCPECNGKSQRLAGRANLEPCRKCNGSGQLTRKTATYTSLVTCDHCNGKRYMNRNQCDLCDSRGFVMETIKQTVHIPPGIKIGDIISVENPRNKQRINYRIQVKESDYYRRIGNDIHTDKYLTISEAVLGGTFKVRGVYQDIELKLEPGTESHTQIRLKNKGIKSPDGFGDHVVTIKICIPRYLSVKQRNLILALAKTEDRTYERNA